MLTDSKGCIIFSELGATGCSPEKGKLLTILQLYAVKVTHLCAWIILFPRVTPLGTKMRGYSFMVM